MKKFLPPIRSWKDIALAAYLWLVLMAYAVVYINFSSFEARKRLYIISVAEVILLVLLYVCPKIMRMAEQFTIDSASKCTTERLRYFLKVWLLFFAAFFVIYIIFYPGGFSADSTDQYAQAAGINHYND